jgi:hypothetical protein
MLQTEERLKSPQIPVLVKLINKIDQSINDGAELELTEPEAVDTVDILRWVLTFLSNRRDYHAKRTTQTKIERALLEDALRGRGVDLEALKKKARDAVADALIDSSNEEPVLPNER